MLLDTHEELIVDLFAGGGGASSGIEQALGRQTDIAINHDKAAVGLHAANHPQTEHYVTDIFEVDPAVATGGRPVGLLWASPDCTFHSKARGSAPIRHANKKRRALAWVVTRWAGSTVAPRVIILENVEEFAQWGPLVGPPEALRPCPRRRGRTFRRWVKSLERHGYEVEFRELRACDFGAPTIRKRLFLIARRDGRPIVWPEPTHGPGKRSPFRTAAECIDWTIPMLSIFATKEEAKEWGRALGVPSPIRPLAENTQRRIARGVKRFVLENTKPYLVTIAHGEGTENSRRWGSGVLDIDAPAPTVMTKNQHAVVSPILAGCGGRAGQSPERPADSPVGTVTAKADACLVATFMAQHNSGFFDGPGREITQPLSTILVNSRGHHGLVAAHIQREFGASTGHKLDDPIGTITSDGGGKSGLVASFMAKFYGTAVGQEMNEPSHTVTSKDRLGLVTASIDGTTYVVADIAMRMLQPKELYRAQGFRDGYIIDRTADGTILTKTEQVRMCGNSVCPPVAESLVSANCSDMVVRTRRAS